MTGCTVFYSGRVQGVGFRSTTVEVARRFAVVGWVKNLPDGRVEVWAEGLETEVTAFLDAVRRQMRGHVSDESRTHRPPTGEYDEFTIAR